MKWIIPLKEKDDVAVQAALSFCKKFLANFNTKKLDWIRIDNGRHERGTFYGRCWYPNKNKGYRVSCQINSGTKFPHNKEQRRKPIYVNDWSEVENITLSEKFRLGELKESIDKKTKWVRVYEKVTYNSFDECVVAIFGHEIGHYLSRTKQIPIRNTEIEIDKFEDAFLETYKKKKNTHENIPS